MNYSKGDVVLLPYPFTDLKTAKVRSAVVAASADGNILTCLWFHLPVEQST